MPRLQDPQLQIWMSTLDLETHDLVNLFQMIDDGDGEISVDERLGYTGVYRLSCVDVKFLDRFLFLPQLLKQFGQVVL